jgi:hypothetical protein
MGLTDSESVKLSVDRLVRAERSEDTFEKIGHEWYAKRSEVWVSEHAARILRRLERDIFPFFGGPPITAIGLGEAGASASRTRSRNAWSLFENILGEMAQGAGEVRLITPHE